MPAEIHVRTLPEERYPEVYALRVETFTAGEGTWPDEGEQYYMPAERRLGAFDGDRLIGNVGAWKFEQWLGGRCVPMGGVAAMIVRPEARGTGVARLLIPEILRRQAEWGDAISCLYPTAPALYRRFGYAMAGTRLDHTIRTDALRSLPCPEDPPSVRVFDFDADMEEVARLLEADAARGQGRIKRSATRHRQMTEPDDDVRSWVATRDGRITGYVQIDREPPATGDRSSRRQHVGDMAAEDRDTWLALWRLLGADATVCQHTSFLSAPHEPLFDELSLPATDVETAENLWMARLIDVRAAITARGWPSGLDVTVALQITDPILRHNNGAFHLMVSRGRAELAPARRRTGTLAIGIGALSALYTGHVSASALARFARLTGGTPADIEALDAAFASPQPYMHDYF